MLRPQLAGCVQHGLVVQVQVVAQPYQAVLIASLLVKAAVCVGCGNIRSST